MFWPLPLILRSIIGSSAEGLRQPRPFFKSFFEPSVNLFLTLLQTFFTVQPFLTLFSLSVGFEPFNGFDFQGALIGTLSHYLQWTFHPFFLPNKRFYTVFIWQRVLTVLVVRVFAKAGLEKKRSLEVWVRSYESAFEMGTLQPDVGIVHWVEVETINVLPVEVFKVVILTV